MESRLSLRGPAVFFVDGVAIITFTVIPIIVDIALLPQPARANRFNPDATRWWRFTISSLLIISIATAEVSALDWYQFYRSQTGQSFSLATAEDSSFVNVSSQISNSDLVMTDGCINQEILKAVTGSRVDVYSPGLAWPKRVNAINTVNASVLARTTTSKELSDADIGWVMTSDECVEHWSRVFSHLLVPVARSQYGTSPKDVITLWKISIRETRSSS